MTLPRIKRLRACTFILFRTLLLCGVVAHTKCPFQTAVYLLKREIVHQLE